MSSHCPIWIRRITEIFLFGYRWKHCRWENHPLLQISQNWKWHWPMRIRQRKWWQKLLFSRDNVSSITGVKITKLLTDGGEFKGVQIEKDGESQEIYADGMFVAIGLIPENEPFKNLANLNNYGYFDSGEDCTTKTAGVFVAGDCRSKYIRQVTTAAADGTIAALAACRYVNEVR